MQILPLRLSPDQDLRRALEDILGQYKLSAGFVLQGIGSLSTVNLRYAGVSQLTKLDGDFEILTLAGSLATNGVHQHMSVSNARGQVTGGHVAKGCIVRTTAEILIALLPEYQIARELDAHTGFGELAIRSAPDHLTLRSLD